MPRSAGRPYDTAIGIVSCEPHGWLPPLLLLVASHGAAGSSVTLKRGWLVAQAGRCRPTFLPRTTFAMNHMFCTLPCNSWHRLWRAVQQD